MDLSNLAAGLIVAALDNLPALAVFCLLQIADVLTTVGGLRRGARESNPFVAELMAGLGHGWILVKLLIAAIAAALILLSGNVWPLWVLNALYAAVVINNWRVSQ